MSNPLQHCWRRRPRRALAALVVTAAAAGTLAGCGSGDAEDSGGITLVSQPNGAGLPLYLADELGYFEDEGLDVTIKDYASGPAALTGGAAGEWQAGWLGAPPALTGGSSFGLIPVGAEFREDANHIMYMRASTLEGSTPAEVLEASKVATAQNTLAEQVMRGCAEDLGVDPASVQIVPLEAGQIVQALKAGQVDVVNTWSTPGFSLVGDDDYEPVCSGESAGIAVLCVYVVTPTFAKENPDQAEAFIRAVYRANEFIVENQDEAADHLLDYYQEKGIEGDREQAEYEVSIRAWATQQEAIEAIESGETADALNASATFFVDAGVYPEAPPVEELLSSGSELLTASLED